MNNEALGATRITLEDAVKFTLEQATKAHRGSRGIAVLRITLTLALDGGGWSSLSGRFTPGKDPVPIV
jgi:hypothetical protein